jgi:hypothetical protein
MKKQILISAVSIFIIVLTAGILVAENSEAERIDLKLRLKPGQKYGVRITADYTQSQTIEGKQENYQNMAAWGVGFEVISVDANGVSSLKTTFRSVQTKMDGPMGRMEYDSNKKDKPAADNVLGQLFGSVVGESFVIKISSKPEIVELKGLKEVMNRVARKVAGYDESVKALLNEGVIERMVSYMTIPFPKEPVAIGGSWTEKGSVPVIAVPHEIEQTFTLKERKKGMVIVDVNAKIIAPGDANYIDMGEGLKMSIRMGGTKHGITEIDEASGWMIRSKEKMRLSGEMKVAPNKEMPEGVTVPMSVEGIITIEPMEWMIR